MHEAELISQLQELLSQTDKIDADDGWFTRRELCTASDLSVTKGARLLAAGMDAGFLECERRRRINRMGEIMSVPAYRPNPNGAVKK